MCSGRLDDAARAFANLVRQISDGGEEKEEKSQLSGGEKPDDLRAAALTNLGLCYHAMHRDKEALRALE